jgi:hypothetical protein
MLWILLGENKWFISKSEPDLKHLLWALLLLKQYSTEIVLSGKVGVDEKKTSENGLGTNSTEIVLSGKVGVDEKTFRKWAWHYVSGISKLGNKLVCDI